MQKDAYYFSHDCNARNDDKIIAIRMRHQMEGYGIYFAIIEKLRESANYMCIKDYNIIAFDLRVSADKVKSIVEEFGLFCFTEDNKYFYSESLLKRLIPFNNLKNQRSEAGKKSAEKRKINDRCEDVQRPLTEKATKERKEKESKEEIEKSNKKEISLTVFDIDFLANNCDFFPVVEKWVKYKNEINSPIKTQMQLESFCKELWRMTSGNLTEAEKLIDYNISRNYKNIYEPDIKTKNGNNKSILQISKDMEAYEHEKYLELYGNESSSN